MTPTSRPSGRARRLVATVAVTFAAVTAAGIGVAQVLALAPVAWTRPLLRRERAQKVILLLGVVRDGSGWWTLAPALGAVLTARAAARRGLPRAGGAVTVAAGAALAGTLATTAAQTHTIHRATGVWRPFTPTVPGRSTGLAPDETVTVAVLDGEPLLADLYRPRDRSRTSPVVVLIHGGGFISGSRGTGVFTTWLAGQGFTVLDVDYRLATADRPTWDTAERDVACTLAWAAEHAEKYGLDLDRVATWGSSAGGTLALQVGNSIARGALTPSRPATAPLPRIRAVVALYPSTDTAHTVHATAGGMHSARLYLGGDPARHPERLAAVSPVVSASAASPPTLVVHGGGDHLHLASLSVDYGRRLDALGVPNRTLVLPLLEHGFGYGSVDAGVVVARSAGLRWLRHHLG